MSLKFLQINAFAREPFAGNPAAVVLLQQPAPDEWMQLIAREFNLSETAFLLPVTSTCTSTCSGDHSADWSLRWLTPVVEVDLCGHATLASAHALRHWNQVPDGEAGGEVRFHTRSGILSARFIEDEIALDFPSTPPTETPLPRGLEQALGLEIEEIEEIVWCGRSRFDIVLQLDCERTVARLQPDFAILKQFEARGVAVTARGEGGNMDFVSRFFAPRLGVDEDPVTGSAHCALAPFWAPRLGKSSLVARQISRRGGELKLRVLVDRVQIRGACITILGGEILQPPAEISRS